MCVQALSGTNTITTSKHSYTGNHTHTHTYTHTHTANRCLLSMETHTHITLIHYYQEPSQRRDAIWERKTVAFNQQSVPVLCVKAGTRTADELIVLLVRKASV